MPQSVTSSNVKHLSDDRDTGVMLGHDSADLVGFYGVTPCDQHPNIADIATTAITTAVTTTTGNCFGFATSTQGDNAMVILDDLRTKFNTLLGDLEESGTHATA